MLNEYGNSCMPDVKENDKRGLAQMLGKMNVEVSRLKKSRGTH